MNIEQSRHNMIEQQIRTWQVFDATVLDTLSVIKREHFVPSQYRTLAFVDTEIPLSATAAMLSPKVEARILQAADVQPTDTILEIGTGSGYMTALLAHLGQHVTTLEIDPNLAKTAEANLATSHIHNVDIILGDGENGYVTEQVTAYDVIVITGSMITLPDVFLSQLKVGGRLISIVGEEPVMVCQLTTRLDDKHVETKALFELSVAPLETSKPHSNFTF